MAQGKSKRPRGFRVQESLRDGETHKDQEAVEGGGAGRDVKGGNGEEEQD